jgi:hypothetical protein
MTGKQLYGPVGAKEPILFNGKLGWIRVYCKECDIDYDIREIDNETTHPAALHVARFDCPKGHYCEARRVWSSYDDGFLKACGIEGQRQDTYKKTRSRYATTEQATARTCLACCLNADVTYCGVRGDLCYFEVRFMDDPDGPKAILSLPTDGLTAEKIAKHAAGADNWSGGGMESGAMIEATLPATAEPELGERRCPDGHDSSIPQLPEVMFESCGHYQPIGAVQLSPARQRWKSGENDSSPGGTTEFSHRLACKGGKRALFPRRRIIFGNHERTLCIPGRKPRQSHRSG